MILVVMSSHCAYFPLKMIPLLVSQIVQHTCPDAHQSSCSMLQGSRGRAIYPAWRGDVKLVAIVVHSLGRIEIGVH